MRDAREVKGAVRAYWNRYPAGYQDVKHLEHERKKFFDERDRLTKLKSPHLEKAYGFRDAQGQKTLEVGCGMGYNAQRLARCGADLLAMDLASKAIELTSERFRLRGLKAGFLIADVENLPFKDRAFDMVFSSGVIHHTPNMQQAVTEIHRVLRKGGQARIMIYHKNSFHYYYNILFGTGLIMLVLNLAPDFLRKRILQSRPYYKNLLLHERRIPTKAEVIRATEGTGLLNPLSHVSTKRSARRLSKQFREISFKTAQPLWGGHSASPLLRKIRDRFGWHLYISAVK